MYIYYILYIHICIHIYTYYAYIHKYIRAVQPDPNPAKPGLIRAKISPILAVRRSMAGGMFRYLTLPSQVSVYPFRDPIPTEARVIHTSFPLRHCSPFEILPDPMKISPNLAKISPNLTRSPPDLALRQSNEITISDGDLMISAAHHHQQEC